MAPKDRPVKTGPFCRVKVAGVAEAEAVPEAVVAMNRVWKDAVVRGADRAMEANRAMFLNML